MEKSGERIGCLREVLEAFEEPLFLIDGSGCCLGANKEFMHFIGASSLAGLEVKDFWPNFKQLHKSKGILNVEFHLGGTARIPVRLSIAEVGDGLLLCSIKPGISAAPLDRFHSQRLETLGMLAGGVAHDFNNVLTGILGHTTYLKAILPTEGPHRESLAAIEDGARKATLMTQQILAFSRLETAEKPAPLDLADLVQRTHALLRGAIPPKYELRCRVPEQPVHVVGVEGKLAQVIVNLVINSRDSLQGAGKINIILDVVEAGDVPTCGSGDLLHDGVYACLTVEDNGAGMTPEVLKRAFEPYFTTKGNHGTGLGLATVQAIVELFCGVIEISSVVAQGTTVKVFLPQLQPLQSDNLAAEHDSGEELAGGTERILIVDDEAPVRNVLMLSLEHLGYSVDAAVSGVEAIDIYRSSADRYDLVIVDMLMPQLSGDEVFFRLKEIDPSVRVLVISGFSSEEAVQAVLDNGGCGFIQKPFTIEDLAEKVRQSLDGESLDKESLDKD